MVEREDKRRAQRAEIKARCRSNIRHIDNEWSALLVNISQVGARFHIEGSGQELTADPPEELELNIETPYGRAECRGCVAWIERKEGLTAIGIDFVGVPFDKNDPLSRFVNAPALLHWLWRTMARIKDRRATPRVYLTTHCPVTFEHGGRETSAFMRNLSEAGAMLHVQKAAKDLTLDAGTELDLTVKTPYGAAPCKGRVVWTRSEEESLFFGVRFTELSQAEGDPLRTFMDSPF